MTETPAIAAIRAAVGAEYPGVQSLGVYNCRPVAGTNTWSQHAWGNAWDIAGPPELLDEIYNYLRGQQGRLPIAMICWRDLGPCRERHDTHIHVEGAPRRTGTPPCVAGELTDRTPGLGDAYQPGDTGPPSTAAGLLQWATDPAGWQRIGKGAAGVALLAAGAIVLLRDVVPAGRLTQAVTAAAKEVT